MPIVSVSLNSKILKQMEIIQRELGFSGRSEVVRAGIRMLLADKKEKSDLVGESSCVLLVAHEEDSEDVVTQTKHEFNDIIHTHIHNKLGRNKCLEIFLLKGDSQRIKKVSSIFQINDRIDQAKLIVP